MIWTLALLPAATGLMIWTLGSASRVALAVLGGAVMVGIAVLSALEPAPASFVWAPDFPLLLDLTDTARAVALTVSVIGLAVLIFAAFHEAQTGLARLMGLLLIFIGAMQLVVSAADGRSRERTRRTYRACSPTSRRISGLPRARRPHRRR